MVTTLEIHHSEIPYKIRDMMDDAITRDAVKDIFRSEHTTIASIMTRDVITLDHTKTAHDAASVMMQKRIGSVIITAYGKPFGIVTERDLARIIATMHTPTRCLILSYLASRPLIYARPTQTIQDASCLMKKYHIDHLPVLENDKIVGMITVRDIAMHLFYA